MSRVRARSWTAGGGPGAALLLSLALAACAGTPVPTTAPPTSAAPSEPAAVISSESPAPTETPGPLRITVETNGEFPLVDDPQRSRVVLLVRLEALGCDPAPETLTLDIATESGLPRVGYDGTCPAGTSEALITRVIATPGSIDVYGLVPDGMDEYVATTELAAIPSKLIETDGRATVSLNFADPQWTSAIDAFTASHPGGTLALQGADGSTIVRAEITERISDGWITFGGAPDDVRLVWAISRSGGLEWVGGVTD